MPLISCWQGFDSFTRLELQTLLGTLWQPLPVLLEDGLSVASADSV